MKTLISCVIMFVFFFWTSGSGQESVSDDSVCFAQATISTDVDGSLVSIDGRFVGRTPLTIDSLMPGLRTVTVRHPETSRWIPQVIERSIHMEPGDSLQIELRFGARVVLRSDPFGAEVRMNDSLWGTTPLTIDHVPSVSVVSVGLSGYETETLDLATTAPGIVAIRLRPSGSNEATDGNRVLEKSTEGTNLLPLVLSGATAIVAGGISAHFKTSADDEYDRYQQTGDPSRLDSTRHLDGLAAVSLVASQISLGLFVYFLFSP
jgi:hypothetical protein